MPITNAKSLIRTTKMCGCTIPYQLSTMIEAHYDNPEAMKEIGINYAAQQIIDLITNGVDGIHIYTRIVQKQRSVYLTVFQLY